jgi:hypothetical protein
MGFYALNRQLSRIIELLEKISGEPKLGEKPLL